MKRNILIFAAMCGILCGCVKTVTRPEVDAAIQSRAHETVNWVSYMGTLKGFHYLRHKHTIGSHTYRIAEAEITIDSPFPLTKDESMWRPLKKHWEGWIVDVEKLEANKASEAIAIGTSAPQPQR